MERLNRVNQQFSKENSASRNVCVNSANRIVNEIYNNSCYKMSYSHDMSSDNLNKSLEPEECVPAIEYDKPSDYVFVDVGSNFIGSEYLTEEDDAICKVSSETLFTDKDIDYNLFKNVTIERRLRNSSKEDEMQNHNLETAVFNINDIYIGSDKSVLSTNACMENVCENMDDYDKKPSIDIDYTTTSTVVSVSGGFEKVNTYVKEEKSIEYVLVPQSTINTSPEIKKEEIVYNEEVSVLNESIIDIKLHPVEESPDISANHSYILDENSKTGFFVLSKSVNSDFQKVHTEYSEVVPDNSEIGAVKYLKPLEDPCCLLRNINLEEDSISYQPDRVLPVVKLERCDRLKSMSSVEVAEQKNESLQNKRESRLKLQNNVQALNRTCNELQIKSETNSEDDTGAAGLEECSNIQTEDAVNTQAKNKNDTVCQHHRKRKSKNTTQRHYICKVCNKNFTQFYYLKGHKCTHTGDCPFGCERCGKTFTQLSHLQHHKCIHTSDRPFSCDTCGKKFTTKSSLNWHKPIHTGDRPFGCDTCGKTFTRLDYLKHHKRIHTGDRPFGCDTCGKSFTQLGGLKSHKRLHTGDRPFGCDICGKTFTHKVSLKEHIRMHTGDRPFGCDTCCKTFATKRALNFHIAVHNGDRPFVCDTCGKTFIHKVCLKRHIPIHTGDRPFGCDTCGKTFIHKSQLIVHIRIHTGDRPFGCDTCGKTFIQKGILKEHIRIHTGDRPFGCDICDKTFTTKSKLIFHKRIHTGDRPFGCDTCGQTFTRLDCLKNHKRIHTDDWPFGCDTCGKTFTQLVSLKHHKRIHTGDRPFNSQGLS